MDDRARIPEPEGYLPLTPAVLDIMVALGEEELHGYAIMREVRRRTGGKRRLAPGTLYRSVGRWRRGGGSGRRMSGLTRSSTTSGDATTG